MGKMAPKLGKICIFLTICFFVNCTAQGLQYLFTAPEYTIQETDGTADTATVILQRTSETAADTTVETSVTLVVRCPAECPLSVNDQEATQGALPADFTLATRTITFAANVLQMSVSITVNNDNLQESREYFCLTVEDASLRGSQYFTTVFIPWNDYCIEHYSMADGGTDAASPGYDVRNAATAVNGFVTPWSPADSETIRITVTPQAATVTMPVTGDGNDISIFLGNGADATAAGFMYYGIQLDDTNANDASHITGTIGSSYFIEGALNTILGTADTTTDFVVADMANTFELSYNAGTITLTRTNPATPAATFTVTDNVDPLTISHLFVSSALNKYTLWEICGIEPRRLPTISATASGSANSFDANNAIDGASAPLSSCFVSASDANNWLQIDLGREYNVREVVIYPIRLADAATGLASPESLDNARIMVGSCRLADIDSNHVCSASIGDVADVGAGTQVPIISVTCAGTNVYGRYVYVRPMTDTNEIGLCDIKVYGDEVAVDMETKVFFTSDQTPVAENVASGNVILPLTRTGNGKTCSYVDYYTESSEEDYTQILPNAAVEVKIVGTTDTQTGDVTIAITDDGVCEATESFDVFLTDVEGAMLGTQCYTTVEITDDDATNYFVVPAVTNIVEGMGPLSIRVTRNGDTISQTGSATLTFTDGTATSTDYSNAAQTVTFAAEDEEETASVTLTNDNCYEGTETFQVTLNQLEPASCSIVSSTVPIDVTITDDDSKFHWEESSLTVSEGAGSRVINIIRTGTTSQKTVEFDVAALGAVLGTDYTITPESRSVTFPAGSVSQPVTINLQEDFAVEGNEIFTLTLRDPSATNCPGGNRGDPYILSVTIQDNDATIRWEVDDYSVTESAGNRQVCLIRSGDTSTIQTVQITSIPGTATADVDYQPLTFFTFTSSDKVCAQVQVIGDEIIEDDETFILRINPDQDLTIGNPSDTNITIVDDDANIGFASTSYEVEEGQTLTVQITKTGDIEVAATISSTPGSASTSDFMAVTRSVTIPAESSVYSIDIQIIDDNIPEDDEQFALTLQGSSTGHVVVGATTVTIKANDGGIATTRMPTTTVPPDDTDGLGTTAIIGITVAAILALFGIIMAIVMSYCLCPIFCEKFRAPRRPSPTPRRPLAPTAQDPSASLFAINNSFEVDYGNNLDYTYSTYNTGYYGGNNRYNNLTGSPLAIQY